MQPLVGTVAGGGGGGSVPAWVEALRSPHGDLPTDALVFTAAHYWSNATEQAVTALLGVGFVPGDIGVSGMEVTSDNSNRPEAIGDLFTSTSQYIGTYIIEMQLTEIPNPSDGEVGYAFYQFGDNGSADGALVGWYGPTGGTTGVKWQACNISNGAYDDVATGTGNAVWKVAFTLKADGSVVSSWGGAAIVTDTASGPTSGGITKVGIGWSPSGGSAFTVQGFTRRIVRYTSQPDADLPTLSA